MALININNSWSIEVQVVSLALHSDSHGERMLDSDSDTDEIRSTLIYLADGRVNIQFLRDAIQTVDVVFSNSRTLYALQSVLNDPMWRNLRITAEAEVKVIEAVTTMGEPNLSLLVKTTWQE